MGGETTFDDLMARLNDGDDEAAAEIFNRFVRRLIFLARSRLNAQVRQKEDPEDVVQSVFRSFFTRQVEGQFEIGNWESLWAMLAVITLRKCGNRIEYFQAAKRNVQRNVPGGMKPNESEESRLAWEGIAREPSPAEAAVLTETLEELMSGLDERERLILSLRLQEYTVQEIGEQVGRSERTIARVLERVRKRMQRIH
jgi:RNA polymerase sigma-70 factor (ECF subfamily)